MSATDTPETPGSADASSRSTPHRLSGSGTAAPSHGPATPAHSPGASPEPTGSGTAAPSPAASPEPADPGTGTAAHGPAGSASRSLVSALSCGVGLLLAMDLAGAWISVASGLNATFLDALGPEARLSAPLPMMIAQVVLVAAATRSRHAVAAAGCLLLTGAGLLAFLSGFFDGGYAADLTPFQRVYQITLVASHLGMSALAGTRLARLLRLGRPAG